ncbi:hypothetical protein AAHA92_02740 [Salvia divinorum]|uniref:Secreted protein n=1 Tax=Salvia divinorum TaxID=28513 RepID=A0ABD1IFX2_SALDI
MTPQLSLRFRLIQLVFQLVSWCFSGCRVAAPLPLSRKTPGAVTVVARPQPTAVVRSHRRVHGSATVTAIHRLTSARSSHLRHG